jgi:putative ABC transport system permease protein
MTLLIRTRSEPADFTSLLRAAIWSIDKDQPVNGIQTMDQAITDSLQGVAVVTTFMGSYAGLALSMAVVGVFGVMAYTVQQRIHEIGIRMALGAGRRDVLTLVTCKGIVLGAIGVGVGLVLVTPFLWLPTGLAPGMPMQHRVSIFVAAGIVLWLVACLASYLPARRAAYLDPILVLHHE